MIEEADGLDKIEQLQEHENADISRKATHILETYLGGHEEDVVAPTIDSSGQSYTFQAAPPSSGFTFS